jgi:predicted anti-sigma-YlaC factor YlaD
LKILIAAIVVVAVLLSALAVRVARRRQRSFDDRSDVTKLVLSAGRRRQNLRSNAKFMRER